MIGILTPNVDTRLERHPSCIGTTHFLMNPLISQNRTACTFSTSQLPKVVRQWCALYILTSKCASRHNGVQIVISHLSSGQLVPHPPLWRAYFSTLRSHKSLEKHSVSQLSYLFAHLHLLSPDSFSSLIFFLLLFSSLTLTTSFFPYVHIVRNLTSKLSSITTSQLHLASPPDLVPHNLAPQRRQTFLRVPSRF